MNEYEVIIGLEIHIQPTTESKMFCGCSADIEDASPNTHTCPVCLGLPGALPVTNEQAVRHALLLGKAFSCQLATTLKFDRKHYFYPDLPKGYQISQYDQPIVYEGKLELPNSDNTVRIRRIHLEEDTARLSHKGDETLVDFNRSGMPLIELVTEPDLTSAEQAVLFLKEIHQVVTHLGISEASMEKGMMRLEPNISVRVAGSESLPDYKVEVKNINSFKYARKAIAFEVERQTELLEAGKKVVQETRGWDTKTGTTLSQRTKEELHDYRYFPEPDLPEMTLSPELTEGLDRYLENLPRAKKEGWEKLGFSEDMIAVMLQNKDVSHYVMEAVEAGADGFATARLVINNPSLMDLELAPGDLARHISQQKESQVSDDQELLPYVEKVIENHPAEVQKYLSGKESVLKFLLGKVMAESKGSASPQAAEVVLKKKLTQSE